MRIIVIGESGVGKTCLMMRYATGDDFGQYRATVGLDCKTKSLVIDGEKVDLAIWDTAGTERFRTVGPSYYRGCHGAILVYDVTDRGTLYKLESWLNELELHGTPHDKVAKMIVGNKIDEMDQQDQEERIRRRKDGQLFAKKHDSMFIETSAKTNQGVKDAFEQLARKIMETNVSWKRINSAAAVNVHNIPSPAKKSSCC
ncbi:ras-related protein Rab-18-like [Anopheles marshallii]|uniref:ras-related protein Rab-18-like n=1 Tax=Anopheles marshallii TaxID=1521116 RepID=UPI00237BF04B|nr:ras-related protein Rab-18-like [Anopheles marshallii]